MATSPLQAPLAMACPGLLPLMRALQCDRASAANESFPGDRSSPVSSETALEPDEMVTAVVLPDNVPETQAFAKVGTRNAMVISTVSCLVMRGDDGFRIALGSVAPTPIRAHRAEELLNGEQAPSDAVWQKLPAWFPRTSPRSPIIGQRRPTAGTLLESSHEGWSRGVCHENSLHRQRRRT